MSRTGPEQPEAPRLPDDLVTAEPGPARGDLDWSGVRVEGDYSGRAGDGLETAECRLVRARFTGATFVPVRLSDTVFEDCELSGAFLQEASLSRVAFRNCRMAGIVLAGGRLRDVVFTDCKLDEANLRGILGERVQFQGCGLIEADLSGATATAARFFGCDLTRAEFAAAKLRGARLHGSELEGIRGAESLKGVAVDSTQLVPLALRLFRSLGITVDDEPEPGDQGDQSPPRT